MYIMNRQHQVSGTQALDFLPGAPDPQVSALSNLPASLPSWIVQLVPFT